MITIDKKEMCCGCTACYSICARNAISMQPDGEGFLYPVISSELCVDCKLCEKICPMYHEVNSGTDKRVSYVIRAKDKQTVKESTSGGFVTPFAHWVLNHGGVICGAVFDDRYQVIHQFISCDNDVKKLRGSKYVQSDLNECFSKIENFLKQGKIVAFVGTTCQVYGLKAYLMKDYKKLITIDLVCHGTPSPKLWDKYLTEKKLKYNAEITSVAFRNKTYGYHSGTMRIEFSNGRVYCGSARVDYMLKSFFKEISSRPSCYQCKFKTLERCSDFTIYDCWHASELVEGLVDDDKGYTNVIVQSDKGNQIMDMIKELYELYQVDTEKAVAKDGIMIRNSAVPHQKRAEYYNDIENNTLKQHINKYISISYKDRVIESSKKWIYSLGIYQFLKKYK